jgi:cellulose synthase/poly-beta-1,6-N-acetylglucosamine synthase-like glycosyltransferase
MSVFFVVPSRDWKGLQDKIAELSGFGYPFVVVCGEEVDHPRVVFREARGKFDAINFGLEFAPSDVEFIALNDADTRIHNFPSALSLLKDESVDLVFTRVDVGSGPQLSFYSYLDRLRRWIPIAASGELMLIRRDVLDGILPLKPCKAEDSYILFKVLEKGGKVAFSEKCYVTTKRTSLSQEEEAYKRRTVGGIYQALSMSRPPALVRLFYLLLPFVSPMLLVSGKNGYHWVKGILLGFVDYLRGDRAASWKPSYGQR